jgi:hypothetical protein
VRQNRDRVTASGITPGSAPRRTAWVHRSPSQPTRARSDRRRPSPGVAGIAIVVSKPLSLLVTQPAALPYRIKRLAYVVVRGKTCGAARSVTHVSGRPRVLDGADLVVAGRSVTRAGVRTRPSRFSGFRPEFDQGLQPD